MKTCIIKLRKKWRVLWNVQEVTYYGVKICTAKDKVPSLVRLGLFKGDYEKSECEFVNRAVTHDCRVLEIGAGIGLVGIIAAKICGPENVFCYEANPELKPMIHHNYRLNGFTPNVTMCAVSSDGRKLTFYKNDNVVSSSIYDRGLQTNQTSIESLAINTLIERHSPQVIIMDVEGAEAELLPSANLSKVDSLVIEMHPQVIGDKAVAGLTATLKEKGFDLIDATGNVYFYSIGNKEK